MSLYSQEERYLRQLLDHVSDAVVATDTHGRVTFANPAAQKLYGIAEDDAIGRGLLELLDMFDAGGNADVEEITGVVAREGHWHGELIQRALDGRDLVVEASVSILSDDDGIVLGSVSIVREISERKAAERVISFQATHDGLTGLLNRTAFMRELHDSLGGGTLADLDLPRPQRLQDDQRSAWPRSRRRDSPGHRKSARRRAPSRRHRRPLRRGRVRALGPRAH